MLAKSRTLLFCAAFALLATSCGCSPVSPDIQPPTDAAAEPPTIPTLGSVVSLGTFSQSKTWRAGTWIGPLGAAEESYTDPAVPVPFVAPVKLRLDGFYARVKTPDVAKSHAFEAWIAPAASAGGFVFAPRFAFTLGEGKYGTAEPQAALVMAQGDALVFHNDVDLYGGAVITARIQLLTRP